jgi:hypothetical protein
MNKKHILISLVLIASLVLAACGAKDPTAGWQYDENCVSAVADADGACVQSSRETDAWLVREGYALPSQTVVVQSAPQQPSSPVQPVAPIQQSAPSSVGLTATHKLPVAELQSMIAAVSNDPYASSLTALIGEHCDNGGECVVGNVPNWNVTGPAAVMVDPTGIPIQGVTVIKTFENVNDGRFGVFYVPAGATVTIPAPGRAAILEGPLP